MSNIWLISDTHFNHNKEFVWKARGFNSVEEMNETIIKNVNTDTLKVWMEHVQRSERTSFYVTHIWAQNAYSQMQVSVPNDYGRKLRVAKRILDETVTMIPDRISDYDVARQLLRFCSNKSGIPLPIHVLTGHTTACVAEVQKK